MAEKGVTSFSTPDDVQRGPAKTARSYGERADESRRRMDEAKSKGGPLGGAPPIEEGKLKPLAQAKGLIPGVGSAYPANQAITRGDTDGPVTMAEADNRPPMSQASLEALQAAKEDAEREAMPGVREAEDEMVEERAPAFDFSSILAAQNPLMSEERRKSIEDKLGDLDIGDLVTKSEISQVIPVVPGFEVEVRTFSQREHLWILNYLASHNGSDMYMDEMLNTLKLACSVTSINGRQYPDHCDANGDVVREQFSTKLNMLSALPVQVIADLGVQVSWFNERVSRLFTAENLKNG